VGKKSSSTPLLCIIASAAFEVTVFQKTFIAGLPQSTWVVVSEKDVEEALCVCAVFLENLKLGVMIQRLRKTSCEKVCNGPKSSVSPAMEYASSECTDAYEAAEEDVEAMWSESFLGGNGLCECCNDTSEVGTH
jgi:hypothetical protein